jgi:sialidase-1
MEKIKLTNSYLMKISIFVIIICVFSCEKKQKTEIKNNIYFDQILFSPGDDGIREFRIPSLVTTNMGTLIATCDARVSKKGDLPNHINIAIRRSTDNGLTWGPLKYVIKSDPTEGSCDPSMLVDRTTGTIWLFALHGNEGIGLWTSKEGFEGSETGHIYAVKSDDDGLTWSNPVNINSMVKKENWLCALAAPGRGFQMANGTLVIPGYFRSDQEPHLLCSYFFYSEDHGKTWNYSTTPAENTTESTIVELSDNRLMLNMRNHLKKGLRAISYTSNMGMTWTPLEFDPELIDPVCQASLIAYETENETLLLFSNSASSNGRKNQSIKISYDEGQSWPVQKTIFKGKSAYSCLTQMSDGSIGLLYEKGNRGAIYFRKVTLDWLKSTNETKKIVVFGNSTTAWRPMAISKVYGQRLEEKLNVNGNICVILNSGIGGSHTGSIKDNDKHKIKHALDRFQTDVLDYEPDIVVLQFGINDSYVDKGGIEGESRISLEEYRSNLNYMVKTLRQKGIHVILMTPNQFDDRKEFWRLDRLEKYTNMMRRVSEENEITLVDIWALNQQYIQKNKTLRPWLLDGVHPNDFGHEQIATALFEEIEKLF